VTRCGIHIPGNRQCPNFPIYRVAWLRNEPKAYETTPPKFRALSRCVCSAHLEMAILQSLDDAPARPEEHAKVTVALL